MRIDPKEVIEPRRVIAVAVRDHHKIEPPQIDAECSYIASKDIGIVASVEEDAFTAILDERGEPPVAGETLTVPEGVVEDRDSIGVQCGRSPCRTVSTASRISTWTPLPRSISSYILDNMNTIVNDLEGRLASRIKAEREARGWSLADLAEHSGVSKAMISKVERDESSPTAALLGRLSGAFGITVSTLLARAEGGTSRIARAREQAIWQDPETGFQRTAVSPVGSDPIELVRCELPAGQSIAYPASSYTFIHQQIWVLKGILHFTEGTAIHELRSGDCLQLGSPANCEFENRQRATCTYLVVVARRQ